MAVKKSSKKPVKLGNKQADEFAFKSFLDRPISELSFLRQSLLFAEVSMISYLSIEQCNIAAGKLGFTDGKFFNVEGAQAYWFQNKYDSVVVCRGTEASDWRDIKADVNALTALAETVGKVHRGFKSEVDLIWPHIEKALEVNKAPLWFCGHSLGGAMAKICAGRCMLSYIKSEPDGLYTYGSPRVGCKRYVNHVKLDHYYRWVNNNDIVTRVPPVWLGYRHSGEEKYLDRNGNLRETKGWRRFSDRLQGFLGGLKKGKIDQLSDHSALAYIDSIFTLVRNEEAKTGKPEPRSNTEPETEVASNDTDDEIESSRQMSA